MTQREDFEAWFVKAYHPASLQPTENGCYLNLGAGMAWDAWQAAQAAQPVGINGLTEAETSASMSVMGLSKPKVAQPAQPTDWRELCRRLYVELFYVDQQLCSVMDENDEPVYTQGSTVRLVLKEASAALAQPANAHAIDTSQERVEKQAGDVQVPSPQYTRGYLVALSDAEEAIDDECRERVVTASDCIEIIRNLGEAPSTKEQSNG